MHNFLVDKNFATIKFEQEGIFWRNGEFNTRTLVLTEIGDKLRDAGSYEAYMAFVNADSNVNQDLDRDLKEDSIVANINVSTAGANTRKGILRIIIEHPIISSLITGLIILAISVLLHINGWL